jgi:hypothetical protein
VFVESQHPFGQVLALQMAQVPLAQIPLAPPVVQGVPSVTFALMTHACCPVLQYVLPSSHGLPPGWHDCPAMHDVHAPW